MRPPLSSWIQARSGATRHVLLLGSLAFKAPRLTRWRAFLNGLLANLTETEFSRLNDPRLCPVLLALPFGLLVVMRRADPLPSGVALPHWADLPVERKRDSFGLLTGRCVAVDYGS